MPTDKTPARRGILGIWRAGRRPGLKAIMVTLLVAVLAVPMLYVSRLIYERSARASAIRQQIAADWGGGAQDIVSPLLVVPLVKRVTTMERILGVLKETEKEERRYAVFTPATVSVEAKLDLHRLKKGIYALNGYEGEVVMSGRFAAPDLAPFVNGDMEVLWGSAYLSLPVSHPRGVTEIDQLTWSEDGRTIGFLPQAKINGVSQAGIHAPVTLAGDSIGRSFRIRMVLRGSERLRIKPLGGKVGISITSQAIAAESIGGFMPQAQDRGAAFSKTSWRIAGTSLDLPHAWRTDGKSLPEPNMLEAAAVGVAFPVPTDYYGQVTRVTRYAPLFVGLTFVTIFLLEVLSRRQFHVVQYTMVGSSLAVFYLLLLALAEQMNFNLAYLIAAGTNTLLLSVYAVRLSARRTVFFYFVPALVAVYGALYAFLEVEDQALLIASVVMLTGLAISMVLTPKVKWYGED